VRTSPRLHVHRFIILQPLQCLLIVVLPRRDEVTMI